MENPGKSSSISREQKCTSTPETKFVSRTRHGTKFRDILKSDKPVKSNLSYADFNYEITRNLDFSLPKQVGSQQSQVLDKRISTDELVRNMSLSDLPSYLEKGKIYREKALDVGVLDWRRLEKWRSCRKQMSGQHKGCSPSSSASSLFPMDGSSAHSSRRLSFSPARQRVHHLSLQSMLKDCPKEAHVRDAKSSSGSGHSCSSARQRMHPSIPQYQPPKVCLGGSTSPDIEVLSGIPQKFQVSPVSAGNNLSRQERVFGAVQCERKESDLKSVSEMGKWQMFEKYEVRASWKGKSKIHCKESAKEVIRSRETKLNAAYQGCSVREKSRDVFMPRDLSKRKCSSLTAVSSFSVDGQLSVDPCHNSILGSNNLEVDLPSKIDHKKQLEPSEPYFQDERGIKGSSQHLKIPLHPATIVHSSHKNNALGIKGAPQASHVLSFPARILSSPSRCRNAEEKKRTVGSTSEIAVQASKESVIRRSSSVLKARNSSPIRRLGSAMGKMIKNAGSRDNSPVRRSSSKECVTNSVSEGVVSSVSIENNKLSTNNNRGRSSPLRRMFDPLLKPIASYCSEPSKKHSSSVVDMINTSTEALDFCAGHFMKINLRHASDSTRALLQVSFKNGLPLFTFVIDNEITILAATVRKSSVPVKGHHSWTYTFFSIREVKKRIGIWLSQGKGDANGYVSNVVAQMKVSDSPSSFTRPDNTDHNITREFNLFAVDGDQYANDFHPTNELAAIIVKLPRSTSKNDSSKDCESSYNSLDKAQDSCEILQEMRSANSDDHSLKNLNFSSTVILPVGVHTVPSKREVSTLAERWRSGGSCDCGGWDLGCQLRLYTNERRTSSGTFLNKHKFQLFSQGNKDSKSILTLVPFKERIYSVEFSSSLSLLQAFAICMSFIDCKRPHKLSEPSVAIEKLTKSCVYEVAMRTKTSNHGEAPAKYVSNPPHSPVGRV